MSRNSKISKPMITSDWEGLVVKAIVPITTASCRIPANTTLVATRADIDHIRFNTIECECCRLTFEIVLPRYEALSCVHILDTEENVERLRKNRERRTREISGERIKDGM